MVLAGQLQPSDLCPCRALPRGGARPQTPAPCAFSFPSRLCCSHGPSLDSRLCLTPPSPRCSLLRSLYGYLAHRVSYWFVCSPLRGEGLLVSGSLLVPQHPEQCLARSRRSVNLVPGTPPSLLWPPGEQVTCPVQPARRPLRARPAGKKLNGAGDGDGKGSSLTAPGGVLRLQGQECSRREQAPSISCTIHCILLHVVPVCGPFLRR